MIGGRGLLGWCGIGRDVMEMHTFGAGTRAPEDRCLVLSIACGVYICKSRMKRCSRNDET